MMLRRLLPLLLAAPLFADPGPSQVRQWIQQLKAPKSQPAALEKLNDVVYSLKDEKLRQQVRTALFVWLEKETRPAIRQRLADVLQSYLSEGSTPTADFQRAEKFLADKDDRVRHILWLAFSQQASQPHITPQLEDRLLGRFDHPDREVRLEALNWALQAVQVRNAVVGEPMERLGVKALARWKTLTEHSDPPVRNLAIYGLLQQYAHDPVAARAVIRTHLDDPHGATRSLLLSFLGATRTVGYDAGGGSRAARVGAVSSRPQRPRLSAGPGRRPRP